MLQWRARQGKLVAHLRMRLSASLLERDYAREFYHRERLLEESPADFAVALEKLARQAFPTRRTHEVNALIRQHFIRGFGNKEVAVAFAVQNPDLTLWGLVAKASEVSDLLKPSKPIMHKPLVYAVDSKDGSKVSGNCIEEGAFCGDWKKEIQGEIAEIKAQIAKNLYQSRSYVVNRPISPIAPRVDFPGICYNCGQPGHTARYCRNAPLCAGCGRLGHVRDRCWFTPPDGTEATNANRHQAPATSGSPRSSRNFLGKR